MGVICDVMDAPETCVCCPRAPQVVREVHIQSPVRERVVRVPVQVPVRVPVQVPVRVPVPVPVPVSPLLHHGPVPLNSSYAPQLLHSPVRTS